MESLFESTIQDALVNLATSNHTEAYFRKLLRKLGGGSAIGIAALRQSVRDRDYTAVVE